MTQIQITLYDKQGRYKPVSTLYTVESMSWFEEHREEVKINGVIKICQKRGWTQRDLAKYGYTTVKMREYDVEKIKQEAKERYERIKQEKGWN